MSLPGLSTKIVVSFYNAFVALNIPQNNLKIIHQFQYCDCIDLSINKTSQELRMLSRSLSDCKSLTLNAMIQVLQFARISQLCHYVT